MKLLKDEIRRILKSGIDISYRIKTRLPDQETMDKKVFTNLLDQLREIEERRDFMEEEIGMDMSQYEDKFFVVIENLLGLVFNKEQLTLIQTYLYQLVPDKEWDGTISIKQGKSEKTVPFKTPSDVWNVVKEFKKQ